MASKSPQIRSTTIKEDLAELERIETVMFITCCIINRKFLVYF